MSKKVVAKSSTYHHIVGNLCFLPVYIEHFTHCLRLLVAPIAPSWSADWSATLCNYMIAIESWPLHVTLVIPSCLWALSDQMWKLSTPKTLACYTLTWARMAPTTFAMRPFILPLYRLLFLALSPPRFKSYKVSAFLGTGPAKTNLLLCLACFAILSFRHSHLDSGYFHSPLVHFVKVSIRVPRWHLLYTSFQSLLKMIHSHFFSGHLC